MISRRRIIASTVQRTTSCTLSGTIVPGGSNVGLPDWFGIGSYRTPPVIDSVRRGEATGLRVARAAAPGRFARAFAR